MVFRFRIPQIHMDFFLVYQKRCFVRQTSLVFPMHVNGAFPSRSKCILFALKVIRLLGFPSGCCKNYVELMRSPDYVQDEDDFDLRKLLILDYRGHQQILSSGVNTCKLCASDYWMFRVRVGVELHVRVSDVL